MLFSSFYYSYSVFLLGLTNNSLRFFAADGRFNCHPLLVYESSSGSILVSSHNWRNLVSEADQGNTGKHYSYSDIGIIRRYSSDSSLMASYVSVISFQLSHISCSVLELVQDMSWTGRCKDRVVSLHWSGQCPAIGQDGTTGQWWGRGIVQSPPGGQSRPMRELPAGHLPDTTSKNSALAHQWICKCVRVVLSED